MAAPSPDEYTPEELRARERYTAIAVLVMLAFSLCAFGAVVWSVWLVIGFIGGLLASRT